MELWDLLNSPIILTIVSFLLVGVLASAISAAWQRRSQRHSLRLILAQEILRAYHNYIRYLRRRDNIEDTDEFSELHAEMLSRSGMAKVLFDEEIALGLGRIANKLATVQDLRLKAHSSDRPKLDRAYKRNLEDAYAEARLVIEAMFNKMK
jgi:hypothetical protein